MFGIARPCRSHLTPADRLDYRSHLCGLCLGLRDAHGQAARMVTNVDVVALLALTEAQRDERFARRSVGPCPLRGMQPADVLDPADPAVAHAIAVSLTAAS